MKYDIDKIVNKHKLLIDKSKIYMLEIEDFEHDTNHINDVISNITLLMEELNISFDYEVCIIATYWHDVGRIYQSDGHEKKSSEMLKEYMQELNYDNDFTEKCINAILYHKWNMTPTTIEGWILKDADKLAWIGIGRWTNCLNNNHKLDIIISLLPKLRNEILYFEESKKLYDKMIIELLKFLYNREV